MVLHTPRARPHTVRMRNMWAAEGRVVLMFGSMHRVRRNRTNVTIQYKYPVSQAEIYYEMYLRERRRRIKYQYRVEAVLSYLKKYDTVPLPTKKALIKILR